MKISHLTSIGAATVIAAICAAWGCDERSGAMMEAADRDLVSYEEASAVESYGRATFAAGCFWGVEAAFRSVDGVKATVAGYTGGDYEAPTYRQVCSGVTGHAEAVEVVYDPELVSFGELLAVFWRKHDPTTPNRQGPDHGTQYRSAVFYHTEEQRVEALESRTELAASGRWRDPIVTEIVPAGTFYRAEEYHQRYLEKQGRAACSTGL